MGFEICSKNEREGRIRIVMKKKIKDLTLEEKKMICEKHETCEDCPLRLFQFHLGSYACAYESEVEVDE